MRRMSQPVLRWMRTHSPPTEGDFPGVDFGVSYEPKIVTVDVKVSGPGYADFLLLPAGTFVKGAFARVVDALDGSGTVELGTPDNPDMFIDTADYDEGTIAAWAQSLGSSNADNAEGEFFAEADLLRVTIGGTPTEGRIQMMIEFYELDNMLIEGGSQFVLENFEEDIS